jgi:hypothetical protein
LSQYDKIHLQIRSHHHKFVEFGAVVQDNALGWWQYYADSDLGGLGSLDGLYDRCPFQPAGGRREGPVKSSGVQVIDVVQIWITLRNFSCEGVFLIFMQ